MDELGASRASVVEGLRPGHGARATSTSRFGGGDGLVLSVPRLGRVLDRDGYDARGRRRRPRRRTDEHAVLADADGWGSL